MKLGEDFLFDSSFTDWTFDALYRHMVYAIFNRLGDNAKDSQVGGKSLVGLNSLAREQTKRQPPLAGCHISVRPTSQLG